MNIRTASITDPGGKAINDDTARVLEENGTYVFVGDGLGGYAGGQQASQAAAEAMMAFSASITDMEDREAFADAAAAADEAVCALQERTGGSMKTTLTYLAVKDGMARWMHVGDTRLYRFRGGRIISQTRDHSVSQMAVMMGEITPDQIRFHEDRNRILRALGAQNARPEISRPEPVEPGDAFLLCTDGFWEFVYEAEMEELLRSASGPAQWLHDMEQLLKTRIPAGTDNYTAAAVIC